MYFLHVAFTCTRSEYPLSLQGWKYRGGRTVFLELSLGWSRFSLKTGPRASVLGWVPWSFTFSSGFGKRSCLGRGFHDTWALDLPELATPPGLSLGLNLGKLWVAPLVLALLLQSAVWRKRAESHSVDCLLWPGREFIPPTASGRSADTREPLPWCIYKGNLPKHSHKNDVLF